MTHNFTSLPSFTAVRPKIPAQIGELLEAQFLSMGVEGRQCASHRQMTVITAFRSKPTKTEQISTTANTDEDYNQSSKSA
jgi:hypothetical protein